ncbi:MAG: hypothetical protein DMF74_21055 [Acidobacteria bacterium]|nr:MAG: hypothetical protein DMF74_21055 [Acidobacteriota bacterium]
MTVTTLQVPRLPIFGMFTMRFMSEIGIFIGSLRGWRSAWTTADLSLAFLRFYCDGNSFAYKQQSRKCDEDCQCRIASFGLLFTRLTLHDVKKPLVWTMNSR